MSQDILFKNINDKVMIVAEHNLSFDNFIDRLKNRLERLYIKDDLLKSNVVLDIRNIELDSQKNDPEGNSRKRSFFYANVL